MTYDEAMANLRAQAAADGVDVRFCALLWDGREFELVTTVHERPRSRREADTLPPADVLPPAEFVPFSAASTLPPEDE